MTISLVYTRELELFHEPELLAKSIKTTLTKDGARRRQTIGLCNRRIFHATHTVLPTTQMKRPVTSVSPGGTSIEADLYIRFASAAKVPDILEHYRREKHAALQAADHSLSFDPIDPDELELTNPYDLSVLSPLQICS
jgi:hypothetical protein